MALNLSGRVILRAQILNAPVVSLVPRRLRFGNGMTRVTQFANSRNCCRRFWPVLRSSSRRGISRSPRLSSVSAAPLSPLCVRALLVLLALVLAVGKIARHVNSVRGLGLAFALGLGGI